MGNRKTKEVTQEAAAAIQPEVAAPVLAAPVEDTLQQEASKTELGGITVVIPYIKSKAQGEELRFALRSWDKNFTENFNVVVIGDREDWFDDEAIAYIEMPQLSDNPQVNVMEALKLAIASELVSDKFIWTNDDIYLVNPIELCHIEVPKVLGELIPDKYKGAYAVNMAKTIELLKEYGRPLLNYGTHTPFLFEKEKIVNLLEHIPAIASGDLLFSSVYFGMTFEGVPILLDWKSDNWSLPVVSANPIPNRLKELAAKKCFVNNAVTGYSPVLIDFLSGLFPEKSSFEI